MASPFATILAAAALSLVAGAAMACPDVAACGGMSRHYGVYTEQASFGPLADSAYYGPAGYDQGPGYDQGYDQGDQGQYDQGPQGYGPPPGYMPPPGPYGPDQGDGQAYDQDGATQGYGAHGSYETRRSGASSSYSSSRSVSESAYDSGWRRVPGAVAGGREGSYAELSVSRSDYDSGWRETRGRTEVLCPPGSAHDRPDPRYGCPLAAGNDVRVSDTIFYDAGGVGPAFIGGGGGGGGGVVIVGGGARAGASAFASARASASVHVGGHWGGHGGGHGHGCGCGGHRGGH